MSTTDIQLWAECAQGSQEARNKLLADHLGLVHHIARQLSRTLSAQVDTDEMVSSGTIGLMSALEGFDPSRGLAFSTFAAPRIRGAILDSMRKQDHAPRSVRRKARELARARETLQSTLGRVPMDAELAEQLGIDLDTLWKWQSDVAGAVQISLDYRPNDEERNAPTAADLLADHTVDIEEQVNHEQEVKLMRDAIMQLKKQERVVLSLYYFEDLKLHEIASILSLTESRVSQIRSKALSRLKEQLGPMRSFAA